jgi:hypothetical protein
MKFREIISEVDRGGEVDDGMLYDYKEKEAPNKQLDLFPDIPSLEPDNMPKNFQIIGRIGEYTIVEDHNEHKANPHWERQHYNTVKITKQHAYVLYFKTEVVGYVVGYDCFFHDSAIAHRYAHNGFQISTVNIHEDHRGKKLTLQLYLWLLNKKYDYILPDETHTHDGVKLWAKLNSSPVFDCVIWNTEKYDYSKKKGKFFNQVYEKYGLIPVLTLNGKSHKLFSEDGE